MTRQFVAPHDYLQREQERIEQAADLEAQRSHLAELQAALLEARHARSTGWQPA